ncbi:MAG: DUF2277 domain-containing protein [Anaerolineales bacterium]
MCRNIVRLRQPDRLPTEDELHHAALQYVRKISGYREPSRVNRPAFDAAVEEIAAASRILFDHLVVAPDRPRPPSEPSALSTQRSAAKSTLP